MGKKDNKFELETRHTSLEDRTGQGFLKLAAIAETEKFEGRISKEEVLVLKALEKVMPSLTKVLSGTAKASSKMVEYIDVKEGMHDAVKNLHGVTSGLGIGSAAFRATDLVTIPATYVAAYTLGKQDKVPFTTTKKFRMLFAAVILGIGIAALAAAPVILPFLSIAASAAVFSMAAYTLVNFVRERNKTNKDIQEVMQELHDLPDIDTLHEEQRNLEEELSELQKDLSEMKAKLNTADSDTDRELILGNVEKLESKTKLVLEDIEKRYTQFERIQQLHDKQMELEVTSKTMGKDEVIKNGVSLLVATASLAGVALSVVFPPVGLALIISAGATGGLLGAYVVGKKVWPKLKETKLGQWMARRLNSKENESELDENSLEMDDLSEVRKNRSTVTRIEEPVLKGNDDIEMVDLSSRRDTWSSDEDVLTGSEAHVISELDNETRSEISTPEAIASETTTVPETIASETIPIQRSTAVSVDNVGVSPAVLLLKECSSKKLSTEEYVEFFKKPDNDRITSGAKFLLVQALTRGTPVEGISKEEMKGLEENKGLLQALDIKRADTQIAPEDAQSEQAQKSPGGPFNQIER